MGREIEFESEHAAAASVIHRVLEFAAYLIQRGSIIPDGNTIGATAAERIVVRHASSRRFDGLPVLFASV